MRDGQGALYISGVRTSVIRPMRKVKPRWRPLTSNSSEGRKQFLYHFPQLNPVFLTDRMVCIANQVFSS
jgi:hypothetical protein